MLLDNKDLIIKIISITHNRINNAINNRYSSRRVDMSSLKYRAMFMKTERA